MIFTRFLALGFPGLLGTMKAGSNLSRGWGQDINWLPVDGALEVAEETRKPIMVIVHKDASAVCQALRPKFAGNPAIAKLSRGFVMINLTAEEVPMCGDKFCPHEAYFPRIMFFSSKGLIMNILGDEQKQKYLYRASSISLIESNMKRVLEDFAECC